MGRPDLSGHLSLNIEKNVGYCVRCSYPIGNLFKWLSKRNFDVPDVDFYRTKVHDLAAMDREVPAPRLSQQTMRLPSGCKPISKEDRASWFFAETLLDKKLTWDQILSSNVHYATDGRLAGYCVFPFYEDEELVYWQGRAAWESLLEDDKLRKVNPHKDEAPLGKNSWLYGVDDAVVGGYMTITEGTLDRITAHHFVRARWGEEAYAVAIQGTTLGYPAVDQHRLNSQFGKLVVLDPKKICILLDADASVKAESMRSELQSCGFDAFVGSLPTKDPNDAADMPDLLERATDPARAGGTWSDILDEQLGSITL
jgi:hypothetical protein